MRLRRPIRHDESQIQIAFINWLATQFPSLLFTASLSGLNLPLNAAMRIKRMGYRAGTPDIMILEPRKGFYGLFIELKKVDGTPSPAQKWFLQALNDRGYCAKIAYGFDDAVCAVLAYLGEKDV